MPKRRRTRTSSRIPAGRKGRYDRTRRFGGAVLQIRRWRWTSLLHCRRRVFFCRPESGNPCAPKHRNSWKRPFPEALYPRNFRESVLPGVPNPETFWSLSLRGRWNPEPCGSLSRPGRWNPETFQTAPFLRSTWNLETSGSVPSARNTGAPKPPEAFLRSGARKPRPTAGRCATLSAVRPRTAARKNYL